MTFEIDPLSDPRWSALVDSHPAATVFHTAGWMRALSKTYGYRPRALTSTPPEAATLLDGLPFCEVQSPFTGRRLVSLPFSDYGGPLLGDTSVQALAEALRQRQQTGGLRYAEIRGGQPPVTEGYGEHQRFLRHVVRLADGPEAAYANLHKGSIARKIQRAAREGLTIEKGASEALLREFYRLFVHTRRRLGVPPPSVDWFRNVLRSMPAGTAAIHLARTRGGEPAGALFVLRHGRVVYYKYGASHEKHHPAGPMPFLFWNLMQDACASGCVELDLGRTDLPGGTLAEFKDRLGGIRSEVVYWRSPAPLVVPKPPEEVSEGWGRKICRKMPERALIWAGSAIYRHIG